MKRASLVVAASGLLLASCGASAAEGPAPTPTAPADIVAETPPAAATTATSETPPQPPARTYLLERVGDIGVVQLYDDHFDELPLEEKILAYHLYRASIAGDRIAYDQRYAHNLAVKDLFESILRVHAASEPMKNYLKALWIHHGIHNMRTSRKTMPDGFTFDDLKAAAHAALAAGATELGTDAEIDALLNRLKQPIFDANFESMCTSKSPPAGSDILSASFNTFYPGLTLADLAGFHDHYPLNSRVTRDGHRLVENVYRAGDATTPSGLYAEDLRGVIVHLHDAIGVGSEKQKAYWEHLSRYFTTGDPEEFRQYNIGWVGDDPRVDAILGFIESYTDARGSKGLWEGITFYRNDERTGIMRKVAQNSPYFEERTPWDPQFRRVEFRPLVANAVDVVIEDGDGGPISPAGINLPNEQAIREHNGSRNFFLHNVIESSDRALGEVSTREFAPTESAAQAAVRCQGAVWSTMVALHEVTGHASGRVSPDLHGDPHVHLRQYYSTLEEARADLVALWHMADPKTVELGLLPDASCVATGYQIFASGFLASLRRYPEGSVLEEDHDRARSLILNFAKDKGAVSVFERDGHFYLRVTDPQAFHTAVGQLLSELQRIKATGDFDAIAHLVEQFGTQIDQRLRADAVARAARIGLPNQFAHVSQRLVVDRDESGHITNVRAIAPESFEALMLEWSGLIRESHTLGAALAPPAQTPREHAPRRNRAQH